MKALIIALTIVLCFRIIIYAQTDNGVVVIVAGDTIGTYQLDNNQIIIQNSLLQFDDNIQEDISESDIRLSPDGQMLAVIQPDQNSLVLTNPSTGKQQAIQLERATEGYILYGWSPDSRYFSLSDRATRVQYIVNTLNGTINSSDILNVSTDIVWMLDSTHLIFEGPSDCRDCLIQSQLYSLELATMSVLPLLNVKQLDSLIENSSDYDNLSITSFTSYNDVAYFTVSKVSESRGQTTVHLYAVDLKTQQIAVASLNTLFPNWSADFLIHEIWYDLTEQKVKLIVALDIRGGYQWAIIEWNVTENIQVVYERSFQGEIVDMYLIASSAVSSDGQQIAIAGVDSTRQISGTVTVIDFTSRTEVWNHAFDKPVCQIEMPSDNLVVYGLTNGRCDRFSDTAKPVNTVVTYNLLTQEQSVLIDSERSVLFVTPER
jgi:hypothetical protein